MSSKLQPAQAVPAPRPGARAAVLLAGLASVLGIPVVGPAAARYGNDTFEGSCEIPATVTFDPPLTGSTREVHSNADGKGPCSGTWTTADGRKLTLDGAPVVYHAEADGRQSCAASEGTTGPGYFRYRQHKIRFTFTESRVGAYTPIRLEGRRGGAFEGTADASPDQDPVEIAQKCASTGLDEARVIIRGSTNPDISG
jgi:hypothetical protein